MYNNIIRICVHIIVLCLDENKHILQKNFLKPVAAIILTNLPTFLVKVVKSFIFLLKSFIGQLLLTFGDFLLVTLLMENAILGIVVFEAILT